MWDHNEENDSASSIMIPYGYQATIWEDNGFTGKSLTLTGGYWMDENLRMNCYNLKDYKNDFGDKMSSIEVMKLPIFGLPARAYWKSMTGSETTNFTIHEGLMSLS